MPAVSIYFADPDGHELEFIAPLPDKPRPEIGVVSREEWNRIFKLSSVVIIKKQDKHTHGTS
jgi:hypothetical protein